jgi:hypothetical protein
VGKRHLKFGSEAWVLHNRDEQHLEAAQMRLLMSFLRYTILDRQRNVAIR